MTAPEGQRGGGKSFGTLVNELVALIITYVKQELVDPLRSLGRYVVFGFLGALMFAVGGGLLALAAIRAVQSATGRHLTGDLSWVPYVGGLIVTAVGAVWAVSRIGKRAKGGAHK
jgi:uncharacterized membrane protein